MGKELWVRTVQFPDVEPTHQSNPFCASTPVADGSRVVVWHGSAGVFCYNFNGEQLWKKDLREARHDWSYASSPIIHRGKIIQNFGPGARTFLTALDLKTGDLLWKRDESEGLIARINEWLARGALPSSPGSMERTRFFAAAACQPGSLPAIPTLAPFAGLGNEKVDLVYASPVVCDDIGVAFTGWITGPTIGFKLGGSGDVTASNRLWFERQPQRIGSGVVVAGVVYIVNAGPGTAQCIECRTGKVLWTERLEGGESWGSLVMTAGRLYVTSRRGITSAFRPNREKLELLAANDLGEPSNATPAISDSQIFLRTDKHVYCIADE